MLRKYSKKGLEKRKAAVENTKKRFVLFEKHWELKNHYCESCNTYLGVENKSYFHDHLIEKSKRPDLDLNLHNLYLVCWECHSKKTNGFPTENHKLAIKKAIELFENN